MDPCTLHETWDEIGPTSERLDGLRTLADLIVDAWGLKSVTVEFGDLPPDRSGQYDPDTNGDPPSPKITIDRDEISDATFAFTVMFHELLHAAYDQWGVPQLDDDELDQAFEGLGPAFTSDFLASCISTDLVESGASGTIPDLGWIMVNE